jgi:hypothetical protein
LAWIGASAAGIGRSIRRSSIVDVNRVLFVDI